MQGGLLLLADDARRALLLFLERGRDGALVLGGGMTRDWLEGEGIAVTGLNSSAGTVDLAMKLEDGRLAATIGGTAKPAAGYILTWPLDVPPGHTTVNGKPAAWIDGELTIQSTGQPIRIIADMGAIQ